MKIFTEPWGEIFAWMPAWAKLSREAREFFVSQIPNTLTVPDRDKNAAIVAEFGRADFFPGKAFALTVSLRPFRRAFRAMYRHPVFDEAHARMQPYAEEHLTRDEARDTLGISWHCGDYFRMLENKAADESWVQTFLECRSGADWAGQIGLKVVDQELAKSAAERLKRWIRRCLEQGNPLCLRALAAEHRKLPNEVGSALLLGIRGLLLFPALRRETLDPVIGIWPAAHRRMTRSVAQPPAARTEPPKGSVVHGMPFAVQDMSAVLVGMFPDGLRTLRSGHGLYKRAVDNLAAMLPPVPAAWMQDKAPVHRVYEACGWLRSIKLIQPKGRALVPTEAGRKWLAGRLEQRLKILLDALRCAYGRRASRCDYSDDLSFAPSHGFVTGWGYDENLDPELRLIEAFAGYAKDQWMDMGGFLDWQAETANPLLSSGGQAKTPFRRQLDASTPEREAHWRSFVENFVMNRLVPLGCARMAVAPSGAKWVALTQAGEYLLGRVGDFELPTDEAVGQIVVQPNFEVVFTGLAPAAESEFMHFAECLGHGVGTLFRITRAATLAAMESGLGAEEILERMGRLAHKPVPANVSSQIRDWTAAYRRVGIRRTVIMSCPDEETALRARSLLPQLVKPLAPRLLEVANPKSIPYIRKKLKQHGVGVEEK